MKVLYNDKKENFRDEETAKPVNISTMFFTELRSARSKDRLNRKFKDMAMFGETILYHVNILVLFTSIEDLYKIEYLADKKLNNI